VRNDDWKSGPLPKLRRVVQRDVPNAGNRRALLLKGDIDITYDLPPKDFSELMGDGGAVKVSSTPIENSMFYLGMNTTKPPFDNDQGAPGRGLGAAVRQAVRQRLYGRAPSSTAAAAR
jgi:peptide/nickel transport system substrate-binding protein